MRIPREFSLLLPAVLALLTVAVAAQAGTTWTLAAALIAVTAVGVIAYKVGAGAFHKRTLELQQEVTAREYVELELKSLSRRLISAQEEDRARIARDLHDDISQRLHGASIGVELSIRGIRTNPDGATERLRKVQEELDLTP